MANIILNKKGKLLELMAGLILIAIGASFRLLPHLANFTPLGAIALFGGVYFSRKMALILPISAMVISDIFIGTYDPKIMTVVYMSFVLYLVLGVWLKNHKKWHTVLATSALGSILFFLLTNFAVWAFTPWYPKDFSGITQCYLMGLPFFRNTLLGDIFFVGAFFGLYESAQVLIQKKFRIAKTDSLPARFY